LHGISHHLGERNGKGGVVGDSIGLLSAKLQGKGSLVTGKGMFMKDLNELVLGDQQKGF